METNDPLTNARSSKLEVSDSSWLTNSAIAELAASTMNSKEGGIQVHFIYKFNLEAEVFMNNGPDLVALYFMGISNDLSAVFLTQVPRGRNYKANRFLFTRKKPLTIDGFDPFSPEICRVDLGSDTSTSSESRRLVRIAARKAKLINSFCAVSLSSVALCFYLLALLFWSIGACVNNKARKSEPLWAATVTSMASQELCTWIAPRLSLAPLLVYASLTQAPRGQN